MSEIFLDLTHRISGATLPYPGDPPPEFGAVSQLPADECRVTRLTMATHTGTHVDAPAHVVQTGKSLADYGLEDFFGQACVVDLRGHAGLIDESALDQVRACDWLLLCTGLSARWGAPEYFTEGPEFTAAFVAKAARLTRKGVGLDCAGLDRDGVTLHREWFANGGELIVENLNALETVLGRNVLQFAAVPMSIEAADGAPVRAYALAVD